MWSCLQFTISNLLPLPVHLYKHFSYISEASEVLKETFPLKLSREQLTDLLKLSAQVDSLKTG